MLEFIINACNDIQSNSVGKGPGHLSDKDTESETSFTREGMKAGK